jgi:hypothetical protein
MVVSGRGRGWYAPSKLRLHFDTSTSLGNQLLLVGGLRVRVEIQSFTGPAEWGFRVRVGGSDFSISSLTGTC